MINRRKKRMFASVVSLVLLFSAVGTAHAQDKAVTSETVYVLLDATGGTREVIVKNGTAEGTSTEEKGVKGELPFTLKIVYSLDGEQTAPEAVCGKSGKIEIKIDITPNNNAKAYYKDNLALQMQFPIDMGEGMVTDMTAEGLTGVTIGSVKTLSGIVLPGEKASYDISYHTKAFEQQSINFVCMPFTIPNMEELDVLDIESQITKLQDGLTQYTDGVSKASEGLSQADAGIRKIAQNGAGLMEGYTQISAGENALLQGMLGTMPPEMQYVFGTQVQQLQEGQKQMADSLSAYTGGVSQASAGLGQVTAGTEELAKNGTVLKEGIDSAVEPLSKMNLSEKKQETLPPESFLTGDEVLDIQFVMKTDALTVTQTKEDVKPAEKPKETFWNRLTALFWRG